jgi:hypothetical protein
MVKRIAIGIAIGAKQLSRRRDHAVLPEKSAVDALDRSHVDDLHADS